MLTAIRDNEYRVLALGYNTAMYKTFIFALAGGLAGLAGALVRRGQRHGRAGPLRHRLLDRSRHPGGGRRPRHPGRRRSSGPSWSTSPRPTSTTSTGRSLADHPRRPVHRRGGVPARRHRRRAAQAARPTGCRAAADAETSRRPVRGVSYMGFQSRSCPKTSSSVEDVTVTFSGFKALDGLNLAAASAASCAWSSAPTGPARRRCSTSSPARPGRGRPGAVPAGEQPRPDPPAANRRSPAWASAASFRRRTSSRA